MAAYLEYNDVDFTRDRWVTLHWDRFILALPQSDVRSVELAADVEEALPTESVMGWLPSKPKPWPVYRFDDRLRFARGLRHDGFVMLLNSAEPWGIWGEGVDVIKGEEALRPMKLPAIFTHTASPARALAVSVDGHPVLVSSAQILQAWVRDVQARRIR